MACSLRWSPPCQHYFLAGQEHGRTIPLPDITASQRGKPRSHSITSSARPSNVSGKLRPSALDRRGDRMRRWEFIILFSMLAATLVAPPQAWPQEAGRTYRLGVLLLTARSMEQTREMTLAQLAKHGFIEGRNLIVDSRIGGPEQLPGFARELVGGKPEAILAVGTSAIRAAQAATATVPIVMMGDDPVGHGWAVSLARPGGNVTGVTILAAELDAKRLQLVHEAMPLARRVAALFRPPENREEIERAMRDVAVSAGLEFHAFDTAS